LGIKVKRDEHIAQGTKRSSIKDIQKRKIPSAKRKENTKCREKAKYQVQREREIPSEE
jgi:hypothetical protein